MSPSPWLVAGLYPLAAGAMALNIWFLSLILGWLGWPIIAPLTAVWAGVPLGLPPAWLYARHLARLMARADGS